MRASDIPEIKLNIKPYYLAEERIHSVTGGQRLSLRPSWKTGEAIYELWGFAGGTGILPVILTDRPDACPTIDYSQ
jgi:hypothetical protein